MSARRCQGRVLVKTYGHFINGTYVEPDNGKFIDSYNPYGGEVWARTPQGGAEDVDQAVTGTSRAMSEGLWSPLTASARGRLMVRLADLVAANAEGLAEIEVRDNGKLLAEMLGQLRYHRERWRYFGGLADKVEGAVVPIDTPGMFAFTPKRADRRGGGADVLELAADIRCVEMRARACGRLLGGG